MPPEPTEGINKNIKVIAEIPARAKSNNNSKGNRKNGTKNVASKHKGNPP